VQFPAAGSSFSVRQAAANGPKFFNATELQFPSSPSILLYAPGEELLGARNLPVNIMINE
jgi:hypothetical protein